MTDAASADTGAAVPLLVRLHLVHAYLQILADQNDVDLLHLKGAAVHPDLSREPRHSLDVDVLVRPSHVERFVDLLAARGWERVTGFDEGSAFGHAMNLHHSLGMVDLHRSWPGFGISAEEAFDELWRHRIDVEIGHVACAAPGVMWQRLILLLHYGRSGGHRRDDLEISWSLATPQTRAEVRSLAQRFDAGLALAAATGELDGFRSDPAYQLWRHFATGNDGRLEEWWGRWRAARGLPDKARVARGFFSVNQGLLRADLGREPRPGDYVEAYRTRFRTARQDACRLARERLRRRSSC